MRIALIGYGKMGREIETLAVSKGHTIACTIDTHNLSDLTTENLRHADAAIEFTRPEAVLSNLLACLKAGLPVVTGTTGWYREIPSVAEKFRAGNGTLLYASNFSIGVQAFFQVNRWLAGLMKNLPDYTVSMMETHHLQKLDKPSGTAITLAESILKAYPSLQKWELKEHPDQPVKETLPILSLRKEGVIGLHEVCYRSTVDSITITHEAYSRKGFAAGALAAAEWVVNKKGVFTMEDLICDMLKS